LTGKQENGSKNLFAQFGFSSNLVDYFTLSPVISLRIHTLESETFFHHEIVLRLMIPG